MWRGRKYLIELKVKTRPGETDTFQFLKNHSGLWQRDINQTLFL
jgi:hypothetical protein